MAARLREIADRLRDPQLPDGEAETLAREAADLLGRASGELERSLREASEGPPASGQPHEGP